jgi:hypothetical protein
MGTDGQEDLGLREADRSAVPPAVDRQAVLAAMIVLLWFLDILPCTNWEQASEEG